MVQIVDHIDMGVVCVMRGQMRVIGRQVWMGVGKPVRITRGPKAQDHGKAKPPDGRKAQGSGRQPPSGPDPAC